MADISSVDRTTRVRARGLGREVSSPEGRLTILKDVDLEAGAGETLAIVGPSGSGKSTLLGLMAGLDLPDTGEIHLGGSEITALDEDGRAALRARHVGFVFQSFHLLPGLTALENVLLPLELRGDRHPEKRARECLGQVRLDHRLRHYPHQLSGGEQQRVALARAFAPQPDILFADEPTGNLDARTGAHIIDLLFDLNAEYGTTLLLVTHDERLAERCDRTLYLIDGQIQGEAA